MGFTLFYAYFSLTALHGVFTLGMALSCILVFVLSFIMLIEDYYNYHQFGNDKYLRKNVYISLFLVHIQHLCYLFIHY